MADRREDATQEALFREVDEDLRHEQLARLWKKYGGVVIALALALVVGVAGYQGWQAWERSARQDEAARYTAAMRLLEQNQTQPAAEALAALAADGNTGYGTVAALRRAALLADQGDEAAAAEAYGAVAADGAADPTFRDLARVLAVLHRMQGPAEGAQPDALIAELQPLTDPANPFRFSALELTAALALKQGDEARARDIYKSLAGDANAPQGLRSRARTMLAALGGDAAAAPRQEG
ncbi:tetratricopeptide repeat protein [Caenispirillum bisanense]|uniref:Ancillary SecYEG translocon subunit/Cell division coordinator CpoB TPR domain-containing protein n=1 Tax=Caenispirillum bisanense TaxID=414052 RepID=A0A286GLE6_9PROT|nr:tetratricopeptide repeat protein [Caenispirillum bisanense]SOD96361.1 hypothetical protein SAMN05421508_105286 [Caenispirillum bisanense]